jgi:flagellin
MVSVNTNIGAFVALQALNATAKDLLTTQNHVSTGLAVAGPKDNAGIYAIAQSMRADVGAYGAVSQSLDRGASTVDVMIAAGQAISDILVEMKQKALAGTDTSLDANSLAALQADYNALASQIDTIVTNASFNGKQLLDGTGGTLSFLADVTGTNTIDVDATADWTSGGGLVTAAAGDDITDNTDALANVTASLTAVNSALAALGSNAKALDVHKTFVGKLSDALKAGIGNLVDADMATESAKLQSLQVKQQLGVQALAIANQSPQVLLALFR